VFTRGSGGTTTIYVDGSPVVTDAKGGTLDKWSDAFPLRLANEAEGNRPWLGTLCEVAIYDVALDASQVDDNFDDGCGPAVAGAALVQVTPNGGIGATTFGNQTISISNQGVPGAPLQDRGVFFVPPGFEVYEGMIVGSNNKEDDLALNVCRTKKLSNMRAAGKDDNVILAPPRVFSLEECLEFIEDDELLEVTPKSLRLRKRVLNADQRKKHGRREEE
jgi:hypothetical protein